MGLTVPGYTAAPGIPPACMTPPMAGTSSSPRSSRATHKQVGGAFSGCFAGVGQHLLRGHCGKPMAAARSGPYHVYSLQRRLQPGSSLGLPLPAQRLREDSVTRDAFLLFYDEFPLLPSTLPGFGGGFFNGAKEFAFRKSAAGAGPAYGA